jgi:putative ABC transport system substrate-binding protein
MRRRALLLASGSLAALRATAQTTLARRVAVLEPGTRSAPFGDWDIFRQRLRALGYTEGGNLIIETWWAEGAPERLPTLAAALVAASPEVALSNTTPAVQALKRASSALPIVMIGVADPVGTRLVESLARPGGNVTGLSALLGDIGVKRLQLLAEMLPGARRFALLGPSGNAGVMSVLRQLQAAAPALGATVQLLDAGDPAAIDRAFAGLAANPVDGLLVTAILYPHHRQIVDLAVRNRIPAAYPRKEFVDSGGLMAYAPDRASTYRRAADYAHRILQGAKPAELPVEQPTTFWFGINKRTAGALGLTIPRSLLLSADAVIE